MQARHLHINTYAKLKEILKKYLRATLYLTWCGAGSWFINCPAARLGL